MSQEEEDFIQQMIAVVAAIRMRARAEMQVTLLVREDATDQQLCISTVIDDAALVAHLERAADYHRRNASSDRKGVVPFIDGRTMPKAGDA